MQVRLSAAARRHALGLCGAVLTAAILLAPCLAEAQSDKDVETARAVFVEGSTLAEQFRWEEARLRYLLSLRLKRAAITFYCLGVVDKEVGRLVEARESFLAFLDEPSAPATKGFEDPARAAVVEIDSRLAAARLAESSTAPLPEPPTVPVAAAPLAPDTAPDRTLPFALMGSGGAVFIAGVVTGLIGLSQAGNATSSMGPDAESARTKGVVGDVLGGIGLATIGAGVIVLLLQKRPEPAKAAAVRPWIGGTSAGVWVRF